MAYAISAGNPYRNLVNTPEGLQKAQDYERNFGAVPSGPQAVSSTDPWTMNATFSPTLQRPVDIPAKQTAAAPALGSETTGVASTLADLIRPNAASAPAQAPAQNPFTAPLQGYLNTPAPTAGTATLADNRFSGGLSAAEQRLQDLISNPSALQDSASYKFRVGQGQQALERSLGARGLLNSGNRLTELTQYGQNMGSQEYEAENARRLALLKEYMGGYGTEQGNNINLLNAQQTSNDRQYGVAADLFKNRGTTLADLYKGADTTGTQRYGIDTTARTAGANTLADLYRTDVMGKTAQLPYQYPQLTNKAWWQA